MPGGAKGGTEFVHSFVTFLYGWLPQIIHLSTSHGYQLSWPDQTLVTRVGWLSCYKVALQQTDSITGLDTFTIDWKTEGDTKLFSFFFGTGRMQWTKWEKSISSVLKSRVSNRGWWPHWQQSIAGKIWNESQWTMLQHCILWEAINYRQGFCKVLFQRKRPICWANKIFYKNFTRLSISLYMEAFCLHHCRTHEKCAAWHLSQKQPDVNVARVREDIHRENMFLMGIAQIGLAQFSIHPG